MTVLVLGEQLEEHLQDKHGVAMGETSADGKVTVEPAYCLGNCALSPAVLLDDKVYGRVTPQRLDALLDGAEEALR